MSDTIETYCDLKHVRQQEAMDRRTAAAETFERAATLAGRGGLTLRKCSDEHYRLSWPNGATINLYPGNKRLYVDPAPKPCPPRLRLSESGQGWLVDVVMAAKLVHGRAGR